MKLLGRTSIVAVMMLGTVLLQSAGDRWGLRLPWYLLHQLVLALIPMIWLLRRVLSPRGEVGALSFVATSALFISASAIFELIAIAHRYWWFSTAVDPLSGLHLGSVPLEEFLFYPLFLNLPILVFLWLESTVGGPGRLPDWPRVRVASRVLGLALLGLGVAVAIWGQLQRTPALDPALLPWRAPTGQWVYLSGPRQCGWTVVQLCGLGLTLSLLSTLWTRLPARALGLTLLCYFPFAMFIELMACGRGWWVWNAQQVLGVFTWVLPIESYAMYLTGAVLPPLVLVWLRPLFPADRPGAG